MRRRYPKLASPDGGHLEVMGCGALTRAAGPHPIFNWVRAVTITGLSEPSIADSAGVLLLRADGVAIRLPGATAARDGELVTVRLTR